MKLLFFTKKTAVPYFSETAWINLKQQIELKFEKLLPLTAEPVRVHFSFITENESDTEKLINKLKETKNEILYPMVSKGRQIIGRSGYLNPEEQHLKEAVLAIAEIGLHVNCLLEDWRIDDNVNTRWYGGLVVKHAEVNKKEHLKALPATV